MKRIITLLLLFATLLVCAQSAVFAATSTATASNRWRKERIGGVDRIETSVLISQKGWSSASDYDMSIDDKSVSPAADVSTSDTSVSNSDADTLPVCAVLANGYDFADALAGVPLAAAVNAPILLTNGTELRSSVLSELERIGAQRVYILGGEKAISPEVEKKLTICGCETVRLAGATRSETAVAIAAELDTLRGNSADTIFIAYGYNYPDALSVGAIAGIIGSPVLYCSAEGTISDAAEKYISSCNEPDLFIIGGKLAIAASAESNIGRLTGGTTERISGSTRYETSLELYQRYADIFTGDDLILASGNDFPDALAGGALAAAQSCPLLLINSYAKITEGLYDAVNELDPECVIILGGTSAIRDDIVNSALSGITMTTTTTSTTAAYTPTPAVRGDHIQRVITIKNDGAKIYTDRSTDSRVVCDVKKRASYDVIDEGPDAKDQYTWFQINVGGKVGWICRTEVTIENTFLSIAKKTFTADEKAVIYLSPSCQGSNAYATGNTTEQKEMEAVAKIVKQILDSEYDCITYIATSSIKINDRTDEALSLGADIYVAIHSNATGTSSVGYGASSYYFPACEQGKQLSKNLVSELNSIAPQKTTLANQVINGMNAFYGIGYSEVREPSDAGMVAILAETEFHDNQIGSDWIRSHHNEIARAYVNALAKTFSIPKK